MENNNTLSGLPQNQRELVDAAARLVQLVEREKDSVKLVYDSDTAYHLLCDIIVGLVYGEEDGDDQYGRLRQVLEELGI